MSRILVDQVRSNSASGDAITLDGNGKCAINATTINSLTFPTSDGSADQIIKTNGSGGLSFTTASGGTIGAFVTDASSTAYTLTSVGYQNGVHSATITPTKASSKILILCSFYTKCTAQPNHGVHAQVRINRAGSQIFESIHARSVYTNGYSGNRIENYGVTNPTHLIDTPTYTLGNSITYTVDAGYQGNTGGVDAVLWNSDQSPSFKLSTFTLMELTT